MQEFFFWFKNFFFDISISGCLTGEREVSKVPIRYTESYTTIFIFRPKKNSFISRILKVAQIKERCQRYQHGALNRMRPFSFFILKIFLFNISIFECGTGEREVSTVTSMYPKLHATIFVFRFKIFFFNIVFYKSYRRKRCQRYQRVALNCMRTFSFYCPKIFSSIFQFLEDA